MLRLINELLGVTMAFILGVYAFRYMNLFYRILFYQLIIYILFYILSYVVQLIHNTSNVQANNQWVFNLSMPIETGILAWGTYQYFKTYKKRFLIWIGYSLFFVVFISEILIKGIWIFSNHGYIAESVLLLVLYLLLLYTQFTKENTSWKRTPKLWISLGIVLYFGGVVPYFSLMHYLQNTHPRINFVLYRFIIEGLANVRYLLLAVGFWLVYRNSVLKTSIANE